VNVLLLDLIVLAAMLVAAVGVVVPVLPGTLLALGALLAWAIITGGALAWATFAIAAVVIGTGQVLKYLLPHRSLTGAGIPGRSVMVGGLTAIVGFFAIPVVGLILGFVAGLYVAEQVRLGDWAQARSSTWLAMKATGFAMLIELGALLLAATVWAGALAIQAGQ
jgi:uncharacterized protein YqgC (DUF456 family)